MLGTDRDTEMIIFTATEDVWVTDFEAESWLAEKSDPVNTRYDHMFVDGRRMLIAQIQDVEVPTLGVLSGSGGHTELACAATWRSWPTTSRSSTRTCWSATCPATASTAASSS